MNPIDVRSQLVEALRLDLVGPDPIRELGIPDAVLPQPPSRWYLTGFLVPLEADESQRTDESGTEELDAAAEGKGTDDAVPPEPTAARLASFPSSMAVSILIPLPARKFAITVRWGDYLQKSVGSGHTAGWSVVRGQWSVVRKEAKCENRQGDKAPQAQRPRAARILTTDHGQPEKGSRRICSDVIDCRMPRNRGFVERE